MTEEDFEDWLFEEGSGNLDLLLEKGFDFSDERVFGLVGRLVRRATAVALIAAPWSLGDELQDLSYANWRDGDMVKLMVVPCRDADQLRRVAIKHGDAGIKKAMLH